MTVVVWCKQAKYPVEGDQNTQTHDGKKRTTGGTRMRMMMGRLGYIGFEKKSAVLFHSRAAGNVYWAKGTDGHTDNESLLSVVRTE